jgi:hypothetical protein
MQLSVPPENGKKFCGIPREKSTKVSFATVLKVTLNVKVAVVPIGTCPKSPTGNGVMFIVAARAGPSITMAENNIVANVLNNIATPLSTRDYAIVRGHVCGGQ